MSWTHYLTIQVLFMCRIIITVPSINYFLELFEKRHPLEIGSWHRVSIWINTVTHLQRVLNTKWYGDEKKFTGILITRITCVKTHWNEESNRMSVGGTCRILKFSSEALSVRFNGFCVLGLGIGIGIRGQQNFPFWWLHWFLINNGYTHTCSGERVLIRGIQ